MWGPEFEPWNLYKNMLSIVAGRYINSSSREAGTGRSLEPLRQPEALSLPSPQMWWRQCLRDDFWGCLWLPHTCTPIINMLLHEHITCVKACMYLYVQHDILKFMHSVVWLNLDGFHGHYLTYMSVRMGSPSVFPSHFSSCSAGYGTSAITYCHHIYTIDLPNLAILIENFIPWPKSPQWFFFFKKKEDEFPHIGTWNDATKFFSSGYNALELQASRVDGSVPQDAHKMYGCSYRGSDVPFWLLCTQVMHEVPRHISRQSTSPYIPTGYLMVETLHLIFSLPGCVQVTAKLTRILVSIK